MNIETPEGMAEAIEWTEEFIKPLADGGTWVVPRSGTIVTIFKKEKRAEMTSIIPDPSIKQVLEAMGYAVTSN